MSDRNEAAISQNGAQVTCRAYSNFKDRQVIDLEFQAYQQIGQGTFGKIHKIEYKGNNYALKVVHQDPNYCNRELEMLEMLRGHENVLQLVYSYYTRFDSKIYLNLITDLLGETLFTRIYKTKHDNNEGQVSRQNSIKIRSFDPESITDITQNELGLWTYDMFNGLAFIHSKGIAHRDMKPENLAMSVPDGRLKILDMGSAKLIRKGSENSTQVCTLLYRAPELLLGNQFYTSKIDIWAAACIICEAMLHQPLFIGPNPEGMLLEIVKVIGAPPTKLMLQLPKQRYKMIKEQSSLKTEVPTNITNRVPDLADEPLLTDLLIMCLDYDTRFDAETALKHPYLKEMKSRSTNRKIASEMQDDSFSGIEIN